MRSASFPSSRPALGWAITLLAAVCLPRAAEPGTGLTNLFFAMDTGTKDARHSTPESQVALVKTLGYDGIGIVGFAPLPEFLESCDRHRLRLFNM